MILRKAILLTAKGTRTLEFCWKIHYFSCLIFFIINLFYVFFSVSKSTENEITLVGKHGSMQDTITMSQSRRNEISLLLLTFFFMLTSESIYFKWSLVDLVAASITYVHFGASMSKVKNTHKINMCFLLR